MYATLHQIHGIPGPQDASWVDEVLTTLRTRATPAGALVTRPLGPGPGSVLALWDDAADASTATNGFDTTDGIAVGPSLSYEIDFRGSGSSASPARYLQLIVFDGPRSPEWSAAYVRAATERIQPAVRDVPGLVESVGGVAADGARFSAVLAESMDALEAAGVAIMSTDLLPGEDPADLTGPDSFTILRLLHADLPVGANQ